MIKRHIPAFLWLFCYAFLAIAGLIWLYYTTDSPLETTLLGRSDFKSQLRPALIGIVTGFIISKLCVFFSRNYESIRKMETEFSIMIGSQSLWDCFILALLSSVAEEIFFRGALQYKLGITVASLAFGIMHWPLNSNLKYWPVFALLMGLILGLEFIYTGTIITPIATHFVVNFLNLNRISEYYKINYKKYEGA